MLGYLNVKHQVDLMFISRRMTHYDVMVCDLTIIFKYVAYMLWTCEDL